jgi:hypothetical protein
MALWKTIEHFEIILRHGSSRLLQTLEILQLGEAAKRLRIEGRKHPENGERREGVASVGNVEEEARGRGAVEGGDGGQDAVREGREIALQESGDWEGRGSDGSGVFVDDAEEGAQGCEGDGTACTAGGSGTSEAAEQCSEERKGGENSSEITDRHGQTAKAWDTCCRGCGASDRKGRCQTTEWGGIKSACGGSNGERRGEPGNWESTQPGKLSIGSAKSAEESSEEDTKDRKILKKAGSSR